MNRNQEYAALLAELEQTPEALEHTVGRALDRQNDSRKKRRLFGIPAGSLAACFLGFMLLVNLFPPFARACGNLPVLRELAKAVAWSPSLSAAVENEYVQPIVGQSQTVNSITATIEYVIVDMKQLNVYYTLESRQYPQLEAESHAVLPGEPGGCSTSSGSFGTPNGELRSARIDFIEREIPETLDFQLKVYAGHSEEEPVAPVPVEEADPFDIPDSEPEYLAEFTFPLELDPTFTAKGELFPVDAVFELDGRTVSITEAEVYPTHMRLNIHTDPDNDAWLTGLDFYMEDETGHQFRPSTNGILSTGMTGGSDDSIIWLDSPYFEGSKSLTLHITRAEWLDKTAPRTRLDLRKGTAENLPEGIRFLKAEEHDRGWVVSFLADIKGEHTVFGLFQHTFWDEAGQAHDITWESSSYGYEDPATGERVDFDSVFTAEYPLENYHGDTAYLEPLFNHVTVFDIPIAIPIR